MSRGFFSIDSNMAAMYHPLIEQIKRKYYQCMDLEGVNVWNDLILLYQGLTVYPQIESKNGYLDGRTIKNKLRSDMSNVPLFFSPSPQSEFSTKSNLMWRKVHD